MIKYLSSSLLVVGLAIACGGTTDEPGGESGGGSSTGGTTSAGSNAGGKGGTVGAGGSVTTGGSVTNGGSVTTGGSVTNGGDGGTTGTAGAGGTVPNGGAGGTGMVDPRCPAQAPTGTCSAEAAGALCHYDLGTGCLCYASATPTMLCMKVDATCPKREGAPPPGEGTGGDTAKIAPVPQRLCHCTSGTWQCSP